MRKYGLVFLFLLSLSSCIKDKINDYDDSRAFMKFYGGAFTDNGRKILQTNDGYLILAETYTQEMDFQIMVMKVSENGNQQWALEIGDSSANYASDFLLNDDNSIFVLGTSYDNTGNSQILIALINNQSNIQWQKIYGRIGFDENPNSVCKTTDDGYLIAGSSNYFDQTTPNLQNKLDYLFFSIDNNGDSVRMRTRGLPENDIAKHIQPYGDGYFLVTGTSENFPASNPNSNIVLLEISNPNLAILNEVHLTDALAENCSYQGIVSRIEGNNIFVFGNKINNSISSIYYKHILADEALNISDTIVTKSFEKSENQVIQQAIAFNNNNEFAYVGFSEALDNNTDIYFSTFDLSGNVSLEKLFGGFGTETAYDIIQTTDGGYAIIGTVGTVDNSDVCLIKIFNDGTMNKE